MIDWASMVAHRTEAPPSSDPPHSNLPQSEVGCISRSSSVILSTPIRGITSTVDRETASDHDLLSSLRDGKITHRPGPASCPRPTSRPVLSYLTKHCPILPRQTLPCHAPPANWDGSGT
ncbi:hypothetical protein Adt_39839 [Abeliophyllum distichum]|uniref:Uncharacterized protein n=1 Tax=Abeliophyllum distichum TaxID=126358 RepID=A0ABD1Q682_9LAMI